MSILKTIPIALDLKRVGAQSQALPTLVEGDNGNVFVITLTDDGEPLDLTNASRVICVFSKTSDGKTVEQDTDDGSVVIGGTDHNVITIALKASSYGAGTNNCEVQIYSGVNSDVLVTTANFNFRGRKGIMNDETIQAEEKYPILVSLISLVTSSTSAADAAAEEATEAAEMIDGMVVEGTVLEPGSTPTVAISEVEIGGKTVKKITFGISRGRDGQIISVNGKTDPDIILAAGDIGTTGGSNVQSDLDSKVPQTHMINGYALSSDLIISKLDAVQLLTASWAAVSGETDVYSQTVTVESGTANSCIELQPSYSQIQQLIEDGTLSLQIDNNNGTFTAYAVGDPPSTDMTIQCMVNILAQETETRTYYAGSYTVTPRVYDQVLETEEHIMSDDLTVETIPLERVSNEQDGVTATIG